MRTRTSALAATLPLLILAACGDKGGGLQRVAGIPDHGIGSFTVAPIPPERLANIVALGNLNPPAHTLPSDHIYLDLPGDSAARVEVVAPADGVVSWVRRDPARDDAVNVSITNAFVYYIGHIALDASIRQGDRVRAGQRLGVASGLAAGIDFGLIDYDHAITGLVSPARYTPETRYAANPLRFFEEPLRSRLYAKVLRTGSEKDGRVGYDIAGRLVGNWFAEGLPVSYASAEASAWPRHLAFAYDVTAPTEPRISIGGTIGNPAVYAVLPSDPRFETVTSSSGIVRYHVGYPGWNGASSPAGTLLVQMLADDRVRVQLVPGAQTADGFTAGAQVYVR